MKRIYTVMVVTILLVSTFVAIAFSDADASSGSSARKVNMDITQFTGGASEAQLDFDFGGGSNSELNITMPKRSKVISASMDIEGIPTLNAKDYDFNSGNHTAYEGDIGSIPPGSKPASYDDTKFDATDVKYIQNENENALAYRYFDEMGTGNLTTGRPYHMFKFIIDDPSPYRFTFYWTGEGYARTGTGSVNEVYTYFFSTQNQSWDQVSYVSKSSAGNVKLTVNQGVGKAANYVDSNKAVYIMVVGPTVTAGITKGYVGTDYVKLTVHSGGSEYPSNIKLDLGADGGTAEWTHPAQLKTKITLDDAAGFKSSLQTYIDAAGTDESNFELVFKFSTGTGGSLRVSDLNIKLEVLEHNDPPAEVAGQLVNFYMIEDTPASGDNLVDLKFCFTDDHDTPDTLRFELAENGAGSADTLEARLDTDGYHLDFIPALDFSGTVMFRVCAIDSGADEVPDTFDDLKRNSHFFNVTVQPVNDAPVIQPYTEPLAVNETETIKFYLTVDDVDDSVFTWESNLTEKVVLTPDPENSSRVEVAATPDEYDVGGSLKFAVIVTDSGGGQGQTNKLKAHLNLSVEVININNPPRFVELRLLPDEIIEKAVEGAPIKFKGDQAAAEDEYYNISVIAVDADLGIEPNEMLKFSVTADDSLAGELSIDAASGLLSLVPTNEDVGLVKFTITVTDWMGESASQDVEVEVENRNDAPRDVKILEPEGRTFLTTDEIDFVGEAYDDDLELKGVEESLTFMWFTNHSSTPLGQGDEIYNIKLNAGIHKITLQVIDAKGMFSSASIELEISAPYVPPPPDDNDGGGGDDNKDGKNNKTITSPSGKNSNTVYLALLAIVIVVVIVIALFFGVLRPKMKKKVEEDRAAAQPAAGLPPIPPMPGMMPQMQQPDYGGMQQMYGTPGMQFGGMQYGMMQPQFGTMQQMQYPQLPPSQPLRQPPQPAQVQHVPQAQVQYPQQPAAVPQPAAVQQPVQAAEVQAAPQATHQMPFEDTNAINIEAKKPDTEQ